MKFRSRISWRAPDWRIRDTGQRRAAFGFTLSRDSSGRRDRSRRSNRDSAAERGGLARGRFLIALNGEAFPRSPERWLRDHQPGRTRHGESTAGRGRKGIFVSRSAGKADAIYQITEIAHADGKAAAHPRRHFARHHRPLTMIRTAYRRRISGPLYAHPGASAHSCLRWSRSPATLMYWVGVKGLVFITRVAGLRVTCGGPGKYPAGRVHVRRESHEQCRCAGDCRRDSAASRHFWQEIAFRYSHRRTGVSPGEIRSRGPRQSRSGAGSVKQAVEYMQEGLRSWSIRRERAVRTDACSDSRRARSSWRSKRAFPSFRWPAPERIA